MDLSGVPIPTIKTEVGYNRKDINIDSTNIGENSAKIITTGIRRRKMLIKCDGNGSFICEKIQSKEDALKELADLLEKGHLTQEEFDHTKKDLGF